MTKKIQAYVDAPIKEHHDLHTGGIAYVVYAPYVDDEVRCVTLVDHQSDKHERVFTESEVRAMLMKIRNDYYVVEDIKFLDTLVKDELGIVLDPEW